MFQRRIDVSHAAKIDEPAARKFTRFQKKFLDPFQVAIIRLKTEFKWFRLSIEEHLLMKVVGEVTGSLAA